MNVIAELNRYYDEVKKTEPDKLLVETSRAMMLAYAMRYEEHDKDVVVRGIEVPFCVELPVPPDLPDEIKPRSPRYINGVIDDLHVRNGKLYGGDLKTAKYADDSYFRELYTNEQLTTYALVAMLSGLGNLEWVWDVISKPNIKPSKLTKADVADIERGVYCGWPVPCVVPSDGRETPELYGVRLLQWYLDSPEKFQRRTYQRNETEILNAIYWWHYQLYQAEQSAKRGGDLNLSHCLRNTGACKNYGELCEYHNICSGFDADRNGYKPREKREGGSDIGVSVSQIRTFNSCQAKWLYKYVERIEPCMKPSNWDTALGSLCHKGRELILGARLQDAIVLPLEMASGVVPVAEL